MPLRRWAPRGHSAGLPAFVPYPFFTGILPIVAPQAPPQRAGKLKKKLKNISL